MIHQEVLLFGIVYIAIHTTHITQTFSMTVVSLGTYEMKNVFFLMTRDRHSTIGYMVFVAGSLVSCMSKKRRGVALSITEAEYLIGIEAIKEAVWFQTFLQAIGILPDSILPILLYEAKKVGIPCLKIPNTIYRQNTFILTGVYD